MKLVKLHLSVFESVRTYICHGLPFWQALILDPVSQEKMLQHRKLHILECTDRRPWIPWITSAVDYASLTKIIPAMKSWLS